MAISEPSRRVMLFGTEEPEPEVIRLNAGPVTLEFVSGAIRNLQIGGIEVVRCINFLVRDTVWGTLRARISKQEVESHSDHFEIRFTAFIMNNNCRMTYQGMIVGKPNGQVSYHITAKNQQDFFTNRTGLIVLYPGRNCAGCPAVVTHTDGTREESSFPTLIKAPLPFSIFSHSFTDIREISHQAQSGLWVTCTMEGDNFEMEDQRNFSDASFKIYNRSITQPIPYLLTANEEIRQSLWFHFKGEVPQRMETREIQVSVGNHTGQKMPFLGMGLSADQLEVTPRLLSLLEKASPRFLVCEMDLTKAHGSAELEKYRIICDTAHVPAVLEVIVNETSSLATLASEVAKIDLPLYAVVVFETNKRTVKEAKSVFSGIPVGGGSPLFFIHLYRNPPPDNVDFVTQTTAAIIHDSDDRAIMQTLETLPAIIASTRALVGNKKLYFGPSNIGIRKHPHAATPCQNPNQDRMTMTSADPRQRGLFAAAWSVGYLSEMAIGQVEAVSLFSPWGPFGIIYKKTDFIQPWYEGSGGKVYPAYHVIAGLAPASGHRLLLTKSSNADMVKCLGYSTGEENYLWMANLTNGDQKTVISGVNGPGSINILDESCFSEAVCAPEAFKMKAVAANPISEVHLRPYAVAMIRWPNDEKVQHM
ncbi:MAG: hypothetical protein ACUVWO_15415 [Thermodesulfobacteriota bacterium]